jgi:hypothetical protein
MALRERSADAMLRDMEDIEEDVLAPAVNRAFRAFLGAVQEAATYGIQQAPTPESLVAALSPGAARVWPLTAGTLTSWWEEFVSDYVLGAVRAAWRAGYGATSDGEETVSSLDNLDEYVARVSDRLVRGLTPPLPDAAMDLVRVAVTLAASFGWSNNELSARIAADLDWETNGAYWRSEYDRLTGDIEAILDPLGPPGTPAREQARESDPRVALLQQQRTRARLQLDNEQSYWETRAQRIARTESTGAYNAAGLAALADEGEDQKAWIATEDSRTRPSHAAADRQVVPLTQPFEVGASTLLMPGDPTGPAHETVNCRCTMVGASVLF